ncbi:MAG: zinc ribbon domain-containing protein, partial [Candidatus Odinarchaeota archaeon]
NCPLCKAPTSLGGNYCEQCGESLLLGKRYETGKVCPACNKMNSESSSHCRFCGAKLSN